MKFSKIAQLVLFAFLVLFVLPACAEEDGIYRFQNVESWVGTLRTTHTSTIKNFPTGCKSGSNIHQFQSSSQVRVTLPFLQDQSDKNQPGHMEVAWGGETAGHGSYQWKEYRNATCEGARSTFNGSGHLSDKAAASLEIVKIPGTSIRGYSFSSSVIDVAGSTREYTRIPKAGYGSVNCDPQGNCSFNSKITDPELIKAEAIQKQLGNAIPGSGHEKRQPYIKGVGHTLGLSESSEKNPMPKNMGSLSGSATVIDDNPEQKFHGTTTVSWNLFPQGRSDFEAEVEIEGYDQWLPKGDRDPKKSGQLMILHVRIKDKKTGKYKLNTVVDKYSFKLINVSKEPGSAMNHPVNNPGKERDLQFEQSLNQGFIVKQNGQLMETKKGAQKGELKDIVLSSFDWGAYGDLVVTAEIGGTPVIGYLKGKKDQKIIPVPKRSRNSNIADLWKEQLGVKGKHDSADDDLNPAADGRKGDGLTLYEEYRGFYSDESVNQWADDGHFRTDPTRKDFFVINNIQRSDVIEGLQRFEQNTEFKVHELLQANARKDRVINFNTSGMINHINQHAMRLMWEMDIVGTTIGGYVPVVDTPRRGGELHIRPSMMDFFINMTGEEQNSFSMVIAHEMMHSACVDHHGETDYGWVQWKTFFGPDGAVVYETPLGSNEESVGEGYPVEVTDETGKIINDQFLFPIKLYVANQKGQHSGVTECMMRYAAAEAYDPLGNTDQRVWIWSGDPYGTGTLMCDSKNGTKEYGNATHGNCRKQLCINDRYSGQCKKG